MPSLYINIMSISILINDDVQTWRQNNCFSNADGYDIAMCLSTSIVTYSKYSLNRMRSHLRWISACDTLDIMNRTSCSRCYGARCTFLLKSTNPFSICKLLNLPQYIMAIASRKFYSLLINFTRNHFHEAVNTSNQQCLCRGLVCPGTTCVAKIIPYRIFIAEFNKRH